jgi:hypothetical protein
MLDACYGERLLKMGSDPICFRAKRTGVARDPLRAGEKLADRVHAQLAEIAARPDLVRSFFRHPSVAYISDL